MSAIPWRPAWHRALYGPDGFYRRHPPARHFATACHGPTGRLLAEALWRWADLLGVDGIVDVGAGRGELLTALHRARPDRRLLGCDVVDRPPGVPAGVGWLLSPGGAMLPDRLRELTDVLVVAHEWLDVVPCDIAQVDDAGALRMVLVEPASGRESLGGLLDGEQQRWCEACWPARLPGERVEIGLARERAWADLCSRVRCGAAIAVDYGHLRSARPSPGTLTAYRDGAVVSAVPDGSCDLTAHVALDLLRQDRLLTQAEALREVRLGQADPATGTRSFRAGDDPAGYLRHLQARAALAQLSSPLGFGSFSWVLARLPEAPRPGAAD